MTARQHHKACCILRRYIASERGGLEPPLRVAAVRTLNALPLFFACTKITAEPGDFNVLGDYIADQVECEYLPSGEDVLKMLEAGEADIGIAANDLIRKKVCDKGSDAIIPICSISRTQWMKLVPTDSSRNTEIPGYFRGSIPPRHFMEQAIECQDHEQAREFLRSGRIGCFVGSQYHLSVLHQILLRDEPLGAGCTYSDYRLTPCDGTPYFRQGIAAARSAMNDPERIIAFLYGINAVIHHFIKEMDDELFNAFVLAFSETALENEFVKNDYLSGLSRVRFGLFDYSHAVIDLLYHGSSSISEQLWSRIYARMKPNRHKLLDPRKVGDQVP